jgi:hypothetical protein
VVNPARPTSAAFASEWRRARCAGELLWPVHGSLRSGIEGAWWTAVRSRW